MDTRGVSRRMAKDFKQLLEEGHNSNSILSVIHDALQWSGCHDLMVKVIEDEDLASIPKEKLKRLLRGDYGG
jgi:hypothetical protein